MKTTVQEVKLPPKSSEKEIVHLLVKIGPDTLDVYLNDEEHGGCMVPIFMLHYEHGEDPEMRPEPIGQEKREELRLLAGSSLVVGQYNFHKSSQTARPCGKLAV